jgi:fatty-acyl-CoA synthase
MLAAGTLGAPLIALNPRYRSSELSYILENSQAKALVYRPQFLTSDYEAVIESTCLNSRGLVDRERFPHLEHLIAASEEPDKLPSTPLNELYKEPVDAVGGANDRMAVFYTSGTTSFPKGACHLQEGIIHHGYYAGLRQEMTSADSVLLAVPICGVLGFVSLMEALCHGSKLVLQEVNDPRRTVELVEREQCTIFNSVDGILGPILDDPELAERMRGIRNGAVGIYTRNAREFCEAAERLCGMKVLHTYGMSEVQALTFLDGPGESIEKRARAGGKPTSEEVQGRIADPETGEVLGVGQPGEMQVRGKVVMAEYLRNPEANARAFTEDGWFRTEDIGHLEEDGGVVYRSRGDDALRLRGFLVSPREIEEYINSHPLVDTTQVVGASTHDGDIAVAFVKLVPGANVSDSDLRTFCRKGIANYKVPSVVELISEFPVTEGANGVKIQKGKLRERAQKLTTAERSST